MLELPAEAETVSAHFCQGNWEVLTRSSRKGKAPTGHQSSLSGHQGTLWTLRDSYPQQLQVYKKQGVANTAREQRVPRALKALGPTV